jgi:hypothetical protein
MAAIATFGLALADIVEQAKLDIDPFTSAHLRGVHGLWAITVDLTRLPRSRQ